MKIIESGIIEWRSHVFSKDGKLRFTVGLNHPVAAEGWSTIEGLLEIARKTPPAWKSYMPNGWPQDKKRHRRRRKPDKIEIAKAATRP